jgi:hypothetical protein
MDCDFPKAIEVPTMFDEVSLRRKVKKLNEAVWERRVPGQLLDDWLSAFSPNNQDGVNEQLQMLYLLSNFLYFGLFEIRHLLRVLFQDLCRRPLLTEIRRSRSDAVDLDQIDDSFDQALDRIRFLGIGNPSESGVHLLYYFRQENSLPSELFINYIDLPGFGGTAGHGAGSVDKYIFIDDLCATGDQAIEYSNRVVRPLVQAHSKARVAYYPLFATSEAIERVRTQAYFNEVSCVVELDKSFKCFADESRFYSGAIAPIDRLLARRICLYYGSILYPRHPLGYKQAELLLGFIHNTPDNTLPIFWTEPNELLPMWCPIFRRYQKM